MRVRARARAGPPSERTQLGRHTRRHLLHPRVAEGEAVRGRRPRHVRLLRTPRGPPRAHRQGHRRARSRRAPRAWTSSSGGAGPTASPGSAASTGSSCGSSSPTPGGSRHSTPRTAGSSTSAPSPLPSRRGAEGAGSVITGCEVLDAQPEAPWRSARTHPGAHPRPPRRLLHGHLGRPPAPPRGRRGASHPSLPRLLSAPGPRPGTARPRPDLPRPRPHPAVPGGPLHPHDHRRGARRPDGDPRPGPRTGRAARDTGDGAAGAAGVAGEPPDDGPLVAGRRLRADRTPCSAPPSCARPPATSPS